MSAERRLRKARRPALIFANGLGDHFLALPAMRALAGLFPGRLTLVCQPGPVKDLLAELPLRRIVEAPMKRRGGREFDWRSVAARLTPCDALISLNPWHSDSMSRLLRALAPAPSIGYFDEFSVPLRLDFGKHSADLMFDVPAALDPALRIEPFSFPPVFARRWIGRFERMRRLFPAGRRILVVHADTGAAKMWPDGRFSRLLDLFLERRRDFLAFVVGGRDLGLDRGAHGDRVIPAQGLPLPLSALLLGAADLFVGVDSSMLHAADLYRIPGVGIFGPTRPAEWGFRFAPHRHVRARKGLASLGEAAVLRAMFEVLPDGPADRPDWTARLRSPTLA